MYNIEGTQGDRANKMRKTGKSRRACTELGQVRHECM